MKPALSTFLKPEGEVEIRYLRGKTGDTGPAGTSGVPGPQGEKGNEGDRGERGEMGPKGPKGDTGPQGERGTRGPKGEKGDVGPEGKPGKDAQGSPDEPDQIIEKLIKAKKKIPSTAIEGFETFKKNVAADHQRMGQQVLSMGGAQYIKLKQSGTPAGQPQTLNLVGATITPKGDGGEVDISFPSGSGFTQLASTETPNGTLTVFTFAAATAQPSFIISDSAMMKATTKSGTVNWTWNAGAKQATMTIPPNEDITAIV